MKTIGQYNERMNNTFKLGECTEQLQKFITEVMAEKSRDGYKNPNAHLNGWETRKLWNKDTELGIRIVRDYYKVVELWYPALHRDYPMNKEVGYTFIELGRMNGNKVADNNFYQYIPAIEWMAKNKIKDLEAIFDEFTDKLGDSRKVVVDYNQEAFDEAWECGDLDGMLEAIGDRDLAEFI